MIPAGFFPVSSSSIGSGTDITIELPYGNAQNTTGKISTG